MIRAILMRFAAGLRFPTLFLLAAGLFVLDLFIPDFIPFADEVLLALLTLLLAAWKRRDATDDADAAAPIAQD